MVRVAAVLVALGALVTGQLAFGGTDQAGSWTVLVGEQKKAPAGTPKGTQLNQFFPGRLTVNAGDKVTFSSFGFHTASYAGGKAIPPDTLNPQGEVYADITDSTGQPFFFDGKQKVAWNGPKLGPVGPNTMSRGTYTSSGAIVAQSFKKAVTATFTFPQTGSFKLLCLIHPGMEMKVAVKAKGASVPTAEEVAATAKAETDAAWAKAKALVAQKPPKNTVFMGVESAKASGGKTTVFDFVPNLTTVKLGTKVKFVMRSPSEAHNAAFGPIKYMEKLIKETDLIPFGPNDPSQVTPFFVHGSDPLGTPYDGTNHGNGFFATPLADAIKGGPFENAAVRVTFTKAGKYHFICMLHGPDMAADIRVTK